MMLMLEDLGRWIFQFGFSRSENDLTRSSSI